MTQSTPQPVASITPHRLHAAAKPPASAQSSEAELVEQIGQLKAQLRQNQAMASLGELTSTATHEFNNVLMTIINYARLGIRNRDDASRDKALSKILEASERAARITSTILAQARNRSDSMEPTDLVALVKDTMVLLEREMNKYRVSVCTEFAEDTVKAMAAGNQIQRVLLNLLINARQAIGEAGQMFVIVRNSDDPAFVEVVVRDSGCGIPAETLPQIFEPFFSTKSGPDDSGKGGTGLGLSACKEIVDAHKGKIRVESSVGVGTAFTIRLPKAPC
ncbi:MULTISPECIES: sensor histidine kinase [Rhodopirellula]|uniref:sensor histidine kinase n=1 Tax=Rhodopirellula sp. MGV TaxID=2023130 RepID=UPI000B979C6D|nr:two-component sensor histidine kinase [Rhodopirellula sp. MGV]PNY35773.1 two-component sensor histidine kinase [Rhodopirellula baltica]